MTSQARQVWRREGVGLAADLKQWQKLRTSRISIRLPTLVHVMRGSKSVEHGSRTLRIGAGQLAVLPCGVYDLTNEPGHEGPYEARSLSVDLDRVTNHAPARFAGSGSGAFVVSRFDAGLREAFDQAQRAIVKSEIPEQVAKLRVLALLEWFKSMGYGLPLPKPSSTSERVRDLIMSQPDKHWDAESVAVHLCMSTPTLRRRLQDHSETFTGILLDVRMSHALWLLQTTSLPVTEVALASGYESHSYFSSRFRERFGFTPTAVRKPANMSISPGSPVALI
jgi:AraC-like DNA-binding protein